MNVGILIDDHMQRPGGVQEYVRGLARYLLGHGHDVVIFTQQGSGTHDDASAGARLVGLGRMLPLKGSGSTTSIPLTLASSMQLRLLLEREACDVLHVMAPYSPTLSGRLLVQSQAAHVMTFLVAIEPGPYRWLVATLARAQIRSLRRFDATIAISTTAADTARALYGGNYHIIPCGVDTSHFHPDLPALPELQNGTVNLLYVGRLERRKGVSHLLQAWARVEPQYAHARLVIGGDGPERRALEQQVRQLGLQHVQFRGYVSASDLPRLLASAHIFCAPATYAASFGIVLIEAMAAGLPISCSDRGPMPEVLGDAGLYFDPERPEEIAEALQRLAEHDGLRARLAREAYARATRYSWEGCAAATFSFIAECATKDKTAGDLAAPKS